MHRSPTSIPFAFALPIAPSSPPRAAGATIDLDASSAAAYSRLAAVADAIVVEGAGGALVPLHGSTDMLDIPARLELPVVLVVGIRLGCLNHALMSALAIRARDSTSPGWVANRIDPGHARRRRATYAALALRLPAPLCADFAWPTPNAFAFGRAHSQHSARRGIAQSSPRFADRRLATSDRWRCRRLGRGIGPC